MRSGVAAVASAQCVRVSTERRLVASASAVLLSGSGTPFLSVGLDI